MRILGQGVQRGRMREQAVNNLCQLIHFLSKEIFFYHKSYTFTHKIRTSSYWSWLLCQMVHF